MSESSYYSLDDYWFDSATPLIFTSRNGTTWNNEAYYTTDEYSYNASDEVFAAELIAGATYSMISRSPEEPDNLTVYNSSRKPVAYDQGQGQIGTDRIDGFVASASDDYYIRPGWDQSLFGDQNISLQVLEDLSTAPASSFIYDYSADSSLYDNDIWGADDITIAADAAQVYRTYFGALDRKPDASGFEWWLNEIESERKSLDDMAAGFFYSDEFQSQADGDGNGTVSNEEFIYHMYNGVFGREPDTEGFNYWLGELQSGARDEAEILSTMTQSDEYVQQTAYQVSLYDFV